jgi:hypothetical protein
MITPQKRPITMMIRALDASGEAVNQKSACVFNLMVLLSNQRLELLTPVESKSELRFNFAESGTIVPNLTKYFQLYFSRCTAGLNRASIAIAIVFICDTSDSLTKYKAQICKSTCSHSVGWFVCKVSQVALRGM